MVAFLSPEPIMMYLLFLEMSQLRTEDDSLDWKMLALYDVLQALSKLSFPVLTNHRPGEGEQHSSKRGTEEGPGLPGEVGQAGSGLSPVLIPLPSQGVLGGLKRVQGCRGRWGSLGLASPCSLFRCPSQGVLGRCSGSCWQSQHFGKLR